MPISGDSGIDPKQLDKFYASKKSFNDLEQRFKALEKMTGDCKEGVASHEHRIN